MTNNGDQRRHMRSAVQVRAEVRLGNGLLMEGRTENVSVNGMLFSSERSLPVGNPCRVVLVLSFGDQELRLHLEGRVARLGNGAMGVEFTKAELDSVEHLRRLVLYNNPQTESAEDDMAEAAVSLRAHG